MKTQMKIGIAPIVWTNDDMPELGKDISFQQAIDEMALAGFAGCEVGNAYPEDTDVLLRELGQRGLCIASRWFGSRLLTEEFSTVERELVEMLDYLSVVGADCVNVCEVSYSTFDRWDQPLYGSSYVMNDDEWRTLADGLNRLGAVAAARGIKLCYHHHLGAVVESAEETDRLMAETEPGKVWLCYDTGHFLCAQGDPVEMLQKHWERVGHVHLKDYRRAVYERMIAENKCFRDGVLEGAFTVPGDGDFDFSPVFAMLQEHGYNGWLVVEAEQDPAKAAPLEYARKARDYIQKAIKI